jgi:hypothetical protein
MSIPLNVATLLSQHVTLELESIDRMYLHSYVTNLQSGGGVASYFRVFRGQPYVSSALMEPISVMPYVFSSLRGIRRRGRVGTMHSEPRAVSRFVARGARFPA